jgi:hypothetical protein
MRSRKMPSVVFWDKEDVSGSAYNLFLATLGYERRARAVAESLPAESEKAVAVGYSQRQVLSFVSNELWFKAHGMAVEIVDDAGFPSWFSAMVRPSTSSGGQVFRALVDISSMTRTRIASVISTFVSGPQDVRYDVDFVYAMAKYSEPSSSPSPNSGMEPVLPFFAGWPRDPRLPVTCIIGLGYEYGKALGLVEHIEPWDAWLYVPRGNDPRYHSDVESANRLLLKRAKENRLIVYDVDNPMGTFMSLESHLSGLVNFTRPNLAPFGPKIFALTCMLASVRQPRMVPVWRVSAGQHEVPIEREPSGEFVGLRVVFE